MEKIAIIGSREGINLDAVRKYVEKIEKRSVIITGGHHRVSTESRVYQSIDRYTIHPTRGVDAAAYDSAVIFGHIPVLVCACWERDGKSAGHVRNPTIIDLCTRAVAFTTGSRGTQAGIDYATRIGRPIEVFRKGDRL